MQLTEDFWSRVDQTGDCWTWKASKTPNDYGRYKAGVGRSRAAHRVSWEIANGPIPEGMFVDHICRTHACVRPDHLRLATPKQNLEHLAKIRSNNTSGYRGVCWNKVSGFWQATVVHNYERHFLGFFDSAAEAGEAARLKRLELYTHNAIDREPGEGGIRVTPLVRCGYPTIRGNPCKKNRGRCHMHDSIRLDAGDAR